jgi:hypothetical protein
MINSVSIFLEHGCCRAIHSHNCSSDTLLNLCRCLVALPETLSFYTQSLSSNQPKECTPGRWPSWLELQNIKGIVMVKVMAEQN